MNGELIISGKGSEDYSRSLVTIFLYLTLFFIPMKRLASLGWIGFSWELSFAKIFIVLTFVLWILKSLFFKDSHLFSSPFGRTIYLAIILYLVVSIMSVFVSTAPGAAIEPIVRRIVLVVLSLIIIKIARDYKTIRICGIALLLGSIPGALAGLFELISGNPAIDIVEVHKETFRIAADLPVTSTGTIRIQGFSGDSDLHAYIYIILMGALLVLLYENFRTGSWAMALMVAVLLGIYMVNIFATGSRAGWIGMTICMVSFLLLSDIKRKWFIISGIIFLYLTLLAVLAIFSNTPVLPRLLGLEGEQSESLRLEEAKLDLLLFRSSPILGTGTGNSYNVAHRYFKDNPSFPKIIADYPKLKTNGYLTILAENGLVGLAAYLLIPFSLMAMMIRSITGSVVGDRKTRAIGFLSVIFAHIFLTVFYPVCDSEFWWLIIGLGTATFNCWEESEKRIMVGNKT